MDRQTVLRSLIEPVVEGLGFVYWGLEFASQSHRSLLRIYIDKPDGGVNIDDCEKVSRQVSAVLDVEDPIASRYTLEVSSPGWDRPLFVEKHYLASVGEVIEIRLAVPFEGRRRFKGKLVKVENEEATLLIEDDEYCFPLESIDKANVVPQF
jgi:ribosome maturation factor RimP